MKGAIVSLGREDSWIDARKISGSVGGLPSHTVHDDTLLTIGAWKALRRNKAPASVAWWCREVLVYPKSGTVFKKGADIVDGISDCIGRQLVFPSFLLPELSLGRNNICLFLDPGDVEIRGKKAVVLAAPASIVVLESFRQQPGWGNADPKTRIPLDTQQSSPTGSRFLRRSEEQGVRPIIRYYNDSNPVVMRTVVADYRSLGFAETSTVCNEALVKNVPHRRLGAYASAPFLTMLRLLK